LPFLVRELIEKYADLPTDFADAVVVALCERLGITRVASVDRHFAIYRHKGAQEIRQCVLQVMDGFISPSFLVHYKSFLLNEIQWHEIRMVPA